MIEIDEMISNAEYCADMYERMNKAIRPALQVLDYKRHAEDHRQLAEWLKDYKRLIEQELFPRGQNGTCNEYKSLMLEQDSSTDSSTDSLTAYDCISREDALMALTGEWTVLTDEIIAKFIKRIRNLPSVTPKLRWIPVDERLPKDYQEVLVYNDEGYWVVTFYDYGNGEYDWDDHGGDMDEEPIAWMPLPAPYLPDKNAGKMSEIRTGSERSDKI